MTPPAKRSRPTGSEPEGVAAEQTAGTAGESPPESSAPPRPNLDPPPEPEATAPAPARDEGERIADGPVSETVAEITPEDESQYYTPEEVSASYSGQLGVPRFVALGVLRATDGERFTLEEAKTAVADYRDRTIENDAAEEPA